MTAGTPTGWLRSNDALHLAVALRVGAACPAPKGIGLIGITNIYHSRWVDLMLVFQELDA